ncbi:hypothetical protein [Cetobacterium sp.]|uniref:hypothetical protein n=1 Tax=Cetobacterium sp. TaxID=2071632 RepID=UPI003F394337
MDFLNAEVSRNFEKRVGKSFVCVDSYPNEVYVYIEHENDREETYSIKRCSDIMCPIFLADDIRWLNSKLEKYEITIK